MAEIADADNGKDETCLEASSSNLTQLLTTPLPPLLPMRPLLIGTNSIAESEELLNYFQQLLGNLREGLAALYHQRTITTSALRSAIAKL